MEAIIFEVVTKGFFALGAIVGFIVWANAGFPFYVPTFGSKSTDR